MKVFDSAGLNKSGRSAYDVDWSTLRRAERAWSSMRTFRDNANRCARYARGDQWSDRVLDEFGNFVKESEIIEREGNVPLKNNRIAPMVRAILGQFASQRTEPVCLARRKDDEHLSDVMTETMKYVYQTNNLWELDRRALEMFVVSGCACFRSYYAWDYEADMSNVWVDLVNYNRLFVEGYTEDPRGKGITLIGEVHDMSIGDVLSAFSKGDPSKARRIKEVYRMRLDEEVRSGVEQWLGEEVEDLSFYRPLDSGLCRVIEVWTKESKERIRCHDTLRGRYYLAELSDWEGILAENARRKSQAEAMGVSDVRLIKAEWIIDRYWYYRYMSPYGDVLAEGETPYKHRGHPYSLKVYPFYNGVARSFVSDSIDVQRHINRLVMMQDFTQKASAKGVLLLPEDALPSSMSIDDIASEWKRHNGIIMYRAKAGAPGPSQLISNASNTGVYDMLSVQLRMFDDVSGVSGALQGQRSDDRYQSFAMYAAQSQNSSAMLSDLMESFRGLRESRDQKNMKLVMQYYDEPRYIGVVGGDGDYNLYDPALIRDVDFTLSLTESSGTLVYRAMQQDFLMQLFSAGAIDVRTLIENSTLGYADKLLASIERNMAQAQGSEAQAQGSEVIGGIGADQNGSEAQ